MKRIALLLGLLVSTVAIWFWIQDSGTDTQNKTSLDPNEKMEPSIGKGAASMTLEEPGTAPANEKKASSTQRTRRTEVEEASNAQITGRCVDAVGKPISNCEVTLRSDRITQKVKPETQSKEPAARWIPVSPARTGQDGRFRLSFAASQSREVRLRFDAERFATYTGKLDSMKQGEVRDLGDIQMLPGARVRGRVTDTLGKFVEKCAISFTMDTYQNTKLAEAGHRFVPTVFPSTHTDSAGRFDLGISLCAGEWGLRLKRQKISPENLVILEGQAQIHIEIQVRSLEETEQIQGHLVDEEGQAIPWARVEYRPRPVSGRSQPDFRSQKDGSFRILRSKHDTGAPVRLRIEKKGFDLLTPSQTFEWGTSGRRLVMIRGASLSIRVLDAETRRAVEDYGVRIRPIGTGRGSSLARMVQQKGHHADGMLRITGLATGRYRIMVAPTTPYLDSEHLAVELPRQSGPPLLFELHQPVRQKLLVVSSKGQPIAGTQVELLEAEQGRPIDAKTFINTERKSTTDANQATLWTQGKTDDSGALTLEGPPSRNLGLRIRGANHVPLILDQIRLKKGGGILRVKVMTGAVIVGTIHPIAVLQRLDRLGSRAASSFGKQPPSRWKAGLRLKGSSPPAEYPTAYEDKFPIAKDGSFRISGISPGSWVLQLAWIRGGGGSYGIHRMNLKRLDNLKDGEERRVTIDVSQLLLGEVQGGIIWNGTLIKKGTVRFEAREGSLSKGTTIGVSVLLDEQGSFSEQLIPAVYDCMVRFRFKGQGFPSLYPVDGLLRVTPGGKQQIQLRVHTAKLRIRYKNHDGKPLARIGAVLIPAGSKKLFYLPPSDAKGDCTKVVPAGSLLLLVPPKHLTTRQGQKKFRALHGKNYISARKKAMLLLRTLNLAPGSQPELIEVKIPKQAGY